MNDSENTVDDPYLQFTREMPSGLLITVNESTDHASEWGTFEVVHAHDDGTLDLKEPSAGSIADSHYRLQPDGDGSVEVVELDDEGYESGWTKVVTIEVVGFDG